MLESHPFPAVNKADQALKQKLQRSLMDASNCIRDSG
jgi:hypothetical protein